MRRFFKYAVIVFYFYMLAAMLFWFVFMGATGLPWEASALASALTLVCAFLPFVGGKGHLYVKCGAGLLGLMWLGSGMAALAVGILVSLFDHSDPLLPAWGLSLLPLGGVVGNVVGILRVKGKGKVRKRTNESGQLSEKPEPR